MIVFICGESFFDALFERLGRACLILKVRDDADEGSIATRLRDAEPAIARIRHYLANLPNAQMAPKLPMLNFQLAGGHAVALQAQNDLSCFAEVMAEFQNQLFNPDYRNPEKPYMRGAYMLDDRIGFQRDRLHNTATLGDQSRQDGYHLINAHHLFGLPVRPGQHFDVTASDGRSLHRVFTDILVGRKTLATSAHINITPDDRIVGKG